MNNVIITNANQKEWELVQPMGGVLWDLGQQTGLDPKLRFTVTGLDLSKLYNVKLLFSKSTQSTPLAPVPHQIVSIIQTNGARLMTHGIDVSCVSISGASWNVGQPHDVYYPKLIIEDVEDMFEVYEYEDDLLKFRAWTEESIENTGTQMSSVDNHQSNFGFINQSPTAVNYGSPSTSHCPTFDNPYYVPDTQDWNTAFINEQSSGTMGNLMNSNPCQLPGTSYAPMQYYQPYPNCQLGPPGSPGRLLEIGGPLDNAITGSGRHDEGARSTEQHSLLNHPREVVRHPPASIMPYVVIKNANQEEWDLMTPMCELRVEESGRRLDPSLKFNVIGLDKDKRYKVEMTFLWSEMEKDGQYGNDWKKTKQSIVLEPKLGSDWMSDGIDFSSLSLTTHISSGNTHELAVLAGHVYQPKLVITEVNDDSKVHEHLDQTLKFNVIGSETPYWKDRETRIEQWSMRRVPEKLSGKKTGPNCHRNQHNSRSEGLRENRERCEPNRDRPGVMASNRMNNNPCQQPRDSCAKQLSQVISNGQSNHPGSSKGLKEIGGRFDGSVGSRTASETVGVEALSFMPSVVIKNSHQEEWDLMQPMCEMTTFPKGKRRMNPPLKFTVTGLDPTKRHEIRLEFLRSVRKICRYFTRVNVFQATAEKALQIVIDKPETDLTEIDIDFSSLGIATQKKHSGKKGVVMVQKDYVYQPKLVITEIGDQSKKYEHSDSNLRIPMNERMSGRHDASCAPQLSQVDFNGQLHHPTSSKRLIEVGGQLENATDSSNGQDESTQSTEPERREGHQREVVSNSPSAPVFSGSATETTEDEGGSMNIGETAEDTYSDEQASDCNNQEVSRGPVTPASETPSVVIKNANQEEWDLMKPMCEMTTYPLGKRRMNPPLKFTVTGLDPTKQYEIQLEFVRSVQKVDYYYTPVNEFETVPDKILNIVQSGTELTRLDIDFSSLSLGTQKKHTGKPGVVMVQKDYVYQPKLVITEIGDQSKKYEHSDRNLRFMVRTQMTNRIITMRKRLDSLREGIVPGTNTSSLVSMIPSVVITNANQKEWDLVQPMCEVVAKPNGIRLNPPLIFSVTGLDEEKMYEVKVTFSRSEQMIEKEEELCWEGKQFIWQKSSLSISLGAMSGSDLMRNRINFALFRLSVLSGYVYLPKVVITEVENPSEVHEHLDDKLKFFVMTYETPRVKELKKQFEALIHARLDEKLHRLLECMRERSRRRKEENKRKNEEKKAIGANRQKESTSTKTKRAPIEHPAEQKRREEGRNNARGERAKRRAETAENPLSVKKRSRRKGAMTMEMQVERSETTPLVMRLRSKK